MKNVFTSRRSRSEDGVRSHVETRVPVRPSLVYAVLGTPEPLKRQQPRIFHGPKEPRGAPKAKLTDSQVLRIRALDKYRALSAARIAEITGVPLNDVRATLTWRNRVHLDSNPEHAEA